MIPSDPLLGTRLHAVGALSSSACYAPQKKVRNWSWQTYWLTQAAFCWFLLPIIGAALTIPHFCQVLAQAPREAMVVSFLLGMAYGIGGTAFNISIRYIGFSLTYAVAVGLSSILGTLVPPLIQHRFGAFLHDLLWTGKLTQPLDYEALRTIFSKTGADLRPFGRGHRSPRHCHLRHRRTAQGEEPAKRQLARRVLARQGTFAVAAGRRPFGGLRFLAGGRRADRRRGDETGRGRLAGQRRLYLLEHRSVRHHGHLLPVSSCPAPHAGRTDRTSRRHREGQLADELCHGRLDRAAVVRAVLLL